MGLPAHLPLAIIGNLLLVMQQDKVDAIGTTGLHNFMFNFLRKNKFNQMEKGQSVLEYVTLIIFILGSLWLMQNYISRGISGRWQSVGDSVGQGRLYDPALTTECAFDTYAGTGRWYNVTCFENRCLDTCVKGITSPLNPCVLCVINCSPNACNQ